MTVISLFMYILTMVTLSAAGARTIIAWGYYGSESNDYAAKNPEKTWVKTCEAFRRVREMERDAILGENRKRHGR